MLLKYFIGQKKILVEIFFHVLNGLERFQHIIMSNMHRLIYDALL